jgi:GrpB-like predicted nucleotidyltransferase (UPF0157 family)
LPGTVVIVEYDPDWPLTFEEERESILGVVGHIVLALEHIGSTAIPGLGAKPIIDMMAGVPGLSEAEECVLLLRSIGYTSVTPQPMELGMYYCLGKGPHSVGYHLHLMKYKSEEWEKHLLFRDYLRSHPNRAREYHELKKRLAALYGSERNKYTESKTSFIESVLAEALATRA